MSKEVKSVENVPVEKRKMKHSEDNKEIKKVSVKRSGIASSQKHATPGPLSTVKTNNDKPTDSNDHNTPVEAVVNTNKPVVEGKPVLHKDKERDVSHSKSKKDN